LKLKKILLLPVFFVLLACCGRENSVVPEEPSTWAQRLGYPAGKKVLILHADDIGMCEEANAAAKAYLLDDKIQSASVMVPCPAAAEFIQWYAQHPDEDVGVHLTLNAEWRDYRWGPVSESGLGSGLVDPDGFLWRDVRSVVEHASAAEVEREIRAQVGRFTELGVKPGHIDTHMGTLYSQPEYTRAYLNLAVEMDLPAMAISFTPAVAQRFREQGYPLTDELTGYIEGVPLPKLDDFHAVPGGASYQEVRAGFIQLIESLQPGLCEIIFHPSIESERLKTITNSWQQRVWESQLFYDEEIEAFFDSNEVIFTNWKQVMARFKERKAG